MKVKVIKSFNDLQCDLLTRKVNDVYECLDERAEQLIDGGFVKPVPDKAKKTKSTD